MMTARVPPTAGTSVVRASVDRVSVTCDDTGPATIVERNEIIRSGGRI
jgi:hypothetical protein